MNKKIKWMGMLAGVCAIALGTGIYNVASVQADASETASFWSGFEISAVAVRTADPAGLRFKTDVERLTPTMKKYNPDAEYYTVLTLTTGGKQYTTKRYADVWRPDGSGWNTVLLGIPESDYETKVTAQSFIKLNGKETAFYQTEEVTISIAQTAAAAISYGAPETYVGEYIEDIVTGITVDQTTASMEVGQTVALTATTAPSGYMAKWTSSNESVATVDNYGNVKGKSVGAATITAEINGYTATCQVAVTARNEAISAYTSSVTIKNSSKTFTLFSGAWLDSLFADERIDAFTFDATSAKAMNVTAMGGNYTVALPANTAKKITFTRSIYEVWKTLGQTDFILTSDYDFGWNIGGSVKITFEAFEKVWLQEASTALTEAEIAELKGIPDYGYNTQQFDFFGYSSMSDGTWTEYDAETGEATEYFSGENFMNVYRIEEYKDAGMTILFPQSMAEIRRSEGDNFDFANSTIKQVMDMAVDAGIGKVVLADKRLYALCEDATESIIGAGKPFATEAELDAQIRIYMQPYVNHPAFYGVMLLDEPNYPTLTAQGDVYRAIKRCYPNAYVQCNLHPPYGGGVGTKFPTPTEEQIAKYTALGHTPGIAERFAAYELYLTLFLDSTGADYIMYDHYPLSDAGTYETYVSGMQVAANVCAARGVKLYFVSQTMTMQQEDEPDNQRVLTEADLRWLNNMQLGFGVKQLAYFTYFTRDNMQSQTFLDNGSFINRDGTKTDLYYAMREILAENQAFAPTILSFDYKTSASYIADGAAYNVKNAQSCSKGNFEKLQNVAVNKESALVSELYDAINNRYMYMVQNIADSRVQTASTLQTVKLTFNTSYQYAVVWKNGEKSVVKLTNNEYVVKLQSGEAVYVIPFNASESGGFVHDSSSGDNGAWFFDSINGTSPWEDAE